MTKDEIIAMAKQARVPIGGHFDETGSTPQELARFAALVAAAEREACAQVCEDVSFEAVNAWKLEYKPIDQGREIGADECAAAIRARSQT